MRGLATVLTVAFVFASTSLLLGQVVGQSTEPSPSDPSYCCEPAPQDATLSGRIVDQDGAPIEGASVSANSYGPYAGKPPEPADDSVSSDDSGSGSSDASIARPCCSYGGGYNSTLTDADGHYAMGVVSGEMSVSVYKDGFASTSAQLSVAPDSEATQDFTLKAFPAKTAHIHGKVTDAKTGKGIGFAGISLRSPEYGLYECSLTDAQKAEQQAAYDRDSPEGQAKIASMPYYGGCAITMHKDGTFEGDVTPGYTIVNVYAWQDCSTSRDADGSSSTSCGPEYLGWSRTVVLPADDDSTLNIALPSRASPDATVSGYLLDAETGEPVQGGQISFSNQETYAYGSATTDQDGSFKIRLRSGYHTVSVYAPGHFSWEGVLSVAKGSNDFDVELTPGQDSYGGGFCCYALDAMAKSAEGAAVPPPAPQASGGAGASNGLAADATSERASGEQYEDLGGGLGPYDASKRSGALQDADGGAASDSGKGAPGLGAVALVGATVAVALLLRRRTS